ncbi:hypothetical protein D3C84_643180 [compost metagenome]
MFCVIVQFAAAINPFNTALPVDVTQVGWTIVPKIGVDGLVITVTDADPPVNPFGLKHVFAPVTETNV